VLTPHLDATSAGSWGTAACHATQPNGVQARMLRENNPDYPGNAQNLCCNLFPNNNLSFLRTCRSDGPARTATFWPESCPLKTKSIESQRSLFSDSRTEAKPLQKLSYVDSYEKMVPVCEITFDPDVPVASGRGAHGAVFQWWRLMVRS